MEQIVITGAKTRSRYLSYLYEKMRGKFSFQNEECGSRLSGGYQTLSFCVDEALGPYLRRFAEENIAEIIAIGYKYEYLSQRLSLPLLTAEEKRLLCTALISADLEEDREYVLRRVRCDSEYSIDGVFNFRLTDLKRRWDGVLEYIPRRFGKASYDDFIGFLVEEGKGTIYLKDGQVFDGNYRLCTQGRLLFSSDLLTEVLLKAPAKIFCFGPLSQKSKEFLLKYYQDKVFFH